jgi:hypothetical protein
MVAERNSVQLCSIICPEHHRYTATEMPPFERDEDARKLGIRVISLTFFLRRFYQSALYSYQK